MSLEKTQFHVSRTLARTAAVLWCISLALPAFVNFGGGGDYWGLTVLLMGWLGVLMLQFAWYANIFLATAIWRLMFTKKRADTPASIAALLSLDTFLVEFVPTGPGSAPIYGLCLGAVVWLVANFLTLLAAHIREVEVTTDDFLGFLREGGNLLSQLPKNIRASLFLLAALVCTFLVLAIHDRIVGNEDERDLLNHSMVAFKRSEVCTLRPKPLNTIVLDGPLELVNNDTSLFSYPESFLAMGIPAVRIVMEAENPRDSKGVFFRKVIKRDYYLENPSDPKSIRWKYAQGESGAQLEAMKLPHSHNDHDSTMEPYYNVKLVSRQGLVGFDIDWMKQYNVQLCPTWYKGRYSMETLVRQTIVIPPKS